MKLTLDSFFLLLVHFQQYWKSGLHHSLTLPTRPLTHFSHSVHSTSPTTRYLPSVKNPPHCSSSSLTAKIQLNNLFPVQSRPTTTNRRPLLRDTPFAHHRASNHHSQPYNDADTPSVVTTNSLLPHTVTLSSSRSPIKTYHPPSAATMPTTTVELSLPIQLWPSPLFLLRPSNQAHRHW